MPKLQRNKGKAKNLESELRNRKFAVRQKDVIERVVQNESGAIGIESTQEKDTAISKQLKKKLRHEAWIEKLDGAYSVRKKQQKKKNNKQNNLAVDLDDFNELLNNIDVNTASNITSTASAPAPAEMQRPIVVASNKIKSKKARKKAEMQEIVRFQKVMQHSAFKNDPLATIRQHVQNTFGQS
ncbi:hypothetical protein DFQ28_007921 [Apophysomyces sp. BC1034]|nr:hypothetical protein DFQ30_007653 [Apophysomyces sp. BC1015]KAG0176044.1 hypothetical protein DFQ29_006628 [Apophysomyces sp. BC1021]KAG0186405.1 hypothetical protein DFQ28_007921 [Apophysomyces sp. BC1034]